MRLLAFAIAAAALMGTTALAESAPAGTRYVVGVSGMH